MNEPNFATNPAKPKLDEKTQFGVSLLFGMVVLGLVIAFIILPSWKKITTAQAELQSNRTLLNRMKNKLSAVEEARANYAAVAGQTAVIDAAIANYSNVPQTVTILEKLAAEVLEEGGPLVLADISVAKMPQDASGQADAAKTMLSKNEVELLVTMTGYYQAVKDFVAKIRGLRHNYYVNRITFSAPQRSNTQTLEVSLNLKYYYFE